MRDPKNKLLPVVGIALSAALLASCGTGAEEADAETTADATEATQWEERLVEGPTNPEDLVAVPGTEVMLVSSMPDDLADASSTGHLRLMDPQTEEVTEIWPDRDFEEAQDEGVFGDCTAPDLSMAAPHGISLEERDGESDRLYVVNHGGRESIEVFTVEPDGDKDVELAWVGCAELPENTMGNGVVADPGSDGFFVTNYFDPADMEAGFEAAFNDEDTGQVLHWTPEGGWDKVPGTDMSSPNGVTVSPDGQYLIVASWGSKDVRRFDLENESDPEVVDLEFLPDNLRWSDDGALLLTGQFIDSFETFMASRAGEAEPARGYSVVEIDTEDFGVSEIASGDPDGFSNPSTALGYDDEIWVGTVNGERLVRLTPQ